jgi:transposase
MDKAYDSNALRAKLDAKGVTPVISPKSNHLDIIVYDKESYQQRNKVERLFNKIKQFRRVATRYEKLKANFLAFVIVTLYPKTANPIPVPARNIRESARHSTVITG